MDMSRAGPKLWMLQTTATFAAPGLLIRPPSRKPQLEHYDISDDEAEDVRERIEAALRNSAVETGGWRDGSLCAYHNELGAKDG